MTETIIEAAIKWRQNNSTANNEIIDQLIKYFEKYKDIEQSSKSKDT